MDRSRWKTVSSRLVYDTPWMTVREDEAINPAGGENRYGHIQFKNRAVAILAIDSAQHTFLVRQSRYTLGVQTWELPMGGCPKHESPLRAAQRELEEETGVVANHWRQVLKLHTSNSLTDELGLAFVATGLSHGQAALEATEDIEVLKLPVGEAVRWAMDGTITDAISVATLLHYQLGRFDPAARV
ncbi:MAG: NUDIX hydrolase [Pseudomonadota bacterium]